MLGSYFGPLRGISPMYLLDKRLDGPQIRSGCSGEDRHSYLCRDSNPGFLAHRHSHNSLSYIGSYSYFPMPSFQLSALLFSTLA
jgi:hypothetical protein